MSLVIAGCYTKEHQFCQKIRCPLHYVLKVGRNPFVMERIPALKNIKESDARRLGINLYRKKKDAFGRYMQDFRNFDQPLVARSYAKEFIYTNESPICLKCRRCHAK